MIINKGKIVLKKMKHFYLVVKKKKLLYVKIDQIIGSFQLNREVIQLSKLFPNQNEELVFQKSKEVSRKQVFFNPTNQTIGYRIDVEGKKTIELIVSSVAQIINLLNNNFYLEMNQRWPKYQYSYNKDDYPFDLRYKWMRLHRRSKTQQYQEQNEQNVYFVEMMTNADKTGKKQLLGLQVQQLTPEMCLKIDEALEQRLSRVYVRITLLHGHYINLESMTLINLINNSSRRIFNLQTLPADSIIYHPISMSSMNVRESYSRSGITKSVQIETFSPQQLLNFEKQQLQSKLQDMGLSLAEINKHEQQIHWMELIAKNKHCPLKESLSNEIERKYLLFVQNLSTGLTEIKWQNQRFILDLKSSTLFNPLTNQIQSIKRVDLKQVVNLKTYLNKLDFKGNSCQLVNLKDNLRKKDLQINEDVIWQYEAKIQKKVVWKSYDNPNQERLERKFQKWARKGTKKDKASFCIKSPTQQFYVDFDKMIEFDPLSHKTTPIRRMVLNESLL